jgi:hypothetical protein
MPSGIITTYLSLRLLAVALGEFRRSECNITHFSYLVGGVRKYIGHCGRFRENATKPIFCCTSKQAHQCFLGSFRSLAIGSAYVLHG